MNAVIFPIPEDAMRQNILNWLETRSESFLQDLDADHVVTQGAPSPRCILVEAGTATTALEVCDNGMLTITVLTDAREWNRATDIARYLKAALPTLTGNGIGVITRVNGPTSVPGDSARPKRVLTANYVSVGSELAEGC